MMPNLFFAQVQSAFQPDESGVVGVVDHLLALARVHGLAMTWEANQCHVRTLSDDDAIDVPLPKSVFRAILARIAVLCKESNTSTMTPYGGEAELTLAGDPQVTLRVAMTNTPGVQNLVLNPTPDVVRGNENASHQHPTANVKELAS